MAESPLRGQHRVGVQFREQEIQSGKIGHACVRGVHGCEHCLANIFRIGVFGMRQEFEGQVHRSRRTRAGAPAPHDLDQGHVDAVG